MLQTDTLNVAEQLSLDANGVVVASPTSSFASPAPAEESWEAGSLSERALRAAVSRQTESLPSWWRAL